MASTAASPLLQILPLQTRYRSFRAVCAAHQSKIAPNVSLRVVHGRRQWLLLLTASTVALTPGDGLPALAQDIPLFGLRRKLEKVEEEVEEIIKEGEKAAEKGLETAEREVEAAEKEIEEAVSFGGLAQAGVVAGAEVVGVLVATSIVNGILGPEAQKS